MHRAVLKRCLEIMSDRLRQDICGLVLPGTTIAEVEEDRIQRCIPPPLKYACQYWVDHLAKLCDHQRKEAGLTDDGTIHAFLQEKILFWLEAMSLIQETPAAVLITNCLDALVDVSWQHPYPLTCDLVLTLSVCS